MLRRIVESRPKRACDLRICGYRAARSYVERDRSRADDYYLGENTGVAERLTATPEGVERAGSMTGDTYEQWVAGIDVGTGAKN